MVTARSGRPLMLSLKLALYLLRQKIKGRERFPLTMILEPLEACNLTCTGCGRIREYEPIIDRQLTVEECLYAVEECDARPIYALAVHRRRTHRPPTSPKAARPSSVVGSGTGVKLNRTTSFPPAVRPLPMSPT